MLSSNLFDGMDEREKVWKEKERIGEANEEEGRDGDFFSVDFRFGNAVGLKIWIDCEKFKQRNREREREREK